MNLKCSGSRTEIPRDVKKNLSRNSQRVRLTTRGRGRLRDRNTSRGLSRLFPNQNMSHRQQQFCVSTMSGCLRVSHQFTLRPQTDKQDKKCSKQEKCDLVGVINSCMRRKHECTMDWSEHARPAAHAWLGNGPRANGNRQPCSLRTPGAEQQAARLYLPSW